ncbi:MAG: hypothetical protein D6718_07380 [Acidobacteria bacterium]|nr:MAG: hypothetical protein D6718_07380 [Acidobacteriota bacterium]
MYQDRLDENLLDEVTRLVGRPVPVVADALGGLFGVLVGELPGELARQLAPFPLTAWQALAPEEEPVRRIWTAALSAGLTAEEVFTVLAVVDDHVRRRFGNEAWSRAGEWARRLAREYDFPMPPSAPGGRKKASRAHRM